MYNYIGENRPNYLIKFDEVGDLEVDMEFKAYGESNSNLSSVVEFKNQHLFIYQRPDGYLEAHLYNDYKFMNGDFKPDEIIEIKELLDDTGKNILPLTRYAINQVELTKLDSGEILLFVNEYKFDGSILLYSFTDNINKIKLKSVLENHEGDYNPETNIAFNKPFKTNSGNIVIMSGLIDSRGFHTSRVYISSDKGLNWKRTIKFSDGYGTGLLHSVSDFIGIKGEILITYTFSVGSGHYITIDPNGQLIKSGETGDMDDILFNNSFVNYKGNYFKYGGVNVVGTNHNAIYSVSNITTVYDLINKDNIVLIQDSTIDVSFYNFSSDVINDKIMYKHSSRVQTYLGVVSGTTSNLTSDVISIDVDKPKDMIGSATIQVNNYMGKYAPDGEINPYMIWINKKMEIFMGYGNDLKKVFTGYIDSVSMESFPQVLEIEARDTLKLANDQVYRENGKYIHTYKDIKIVTFIHKLAKFAGIKIGRVDDNEFRLKEYEINYDTVYDIMVEMADILGYELTVDNDGRLNFVNEQPNPNQQVEYTFKSGENITAINYRIDDSELYHTVIVQGSKEREIKDKKGVKKKIKEVVTYKDDYIGRNNYNLPAGKILRIEESSLSDMEDLKEIADRALYLMKVRARQVGFEAIANSNIKIGDFIQVFEESTTISEVYRVTGLSYTMDSDGYLMNIECYHHDRRVV